MGQGVHWTGARKWAVVLGVGVSLTGACGGDGAPESEAPARGGSSAGGEVAPGGPPAGGFANQGNEADTTPAAGVAGSGTTASGRPTGSVGTSGEGTLQSGSPSDAAVASVLDAINSSEVEAGELAAQKARDPEVRRYASDMVAAHRVAPLDKPVEAQGTNGASDFLTPLRDTHGKTMRALQSAAAGATFDRAYITAQVQAHEGALQTLERLETAARESALTERLRRTQGEVRQHLERARAIQARVSRGA